MSTKQKQAAQPPPQALTPQQLQQQALKQQISLLNKLYQASKEELKNKQEEQVKLQETMQQIKDTNEKMIVAEQQATESLDKIEEPETVKEKISSEEQLLVQPRELLEKMRVQTLDIQKQLKLMDDLMSKQTEDTKQKQISMGQLRPQHQKLQIEKDKKYNNCIGNQKVLKNALQQIDLSKQCIEYYQSGLKETPEEQQLKFTQNTEELKNLKGQLEEKLTLIQQSCKEKLQKVYELRGKHEESTITTE